MILNVRFLLLLFSTLLICGCAARQLPEKGPAKLYSSFHARYSQCNETGIRAKASLYYTSQNRGHRTTMTLWGDLDTPLRLDVRAGIGAYIAHIREDETGLTAFYPDQRTAYTHSSATRGVQQLGLPFPFCLKDLAGLISGCYQSLIPANYDSAISVNENGNMQYIFNSGPVSSVTLNGQGIPVNMTGRGEIPWTMELASFENNSKGKPLPGKITVFTENGDKAVLRIKSREYAAEKWPADSLTLELPEGTETIALDRDGYLQLIEKEAL